MYLVRGSLIAALYTVLTLLIYPLGFGPVQIRFSEMLTILPVLFPEAVPGLTVGCFLSNLVGMATGSNMVGGWDLLIGTAATALAAVACRLFRRVRYRGLPLLSASMAVWCNGVIVGAELYVTYGGFPLLLQMLVIAAGEAIAAVGGGLLLWWILKRKRL